MAYEVFYAVHQFEGPGVVGGTFPREETYTLSGGPGQTPTAIMVVYSASALTLDVDNNNSRLSVGFADTSAQRSVCIIQEHNAAAAAADAGCRTDTDTVVQVTGINGAAFETEARFISFGTDSATLDWTATSSGHGYIVFFYAVDSAVGNSTSSASIGGTASVSGLGFQPDVVLAAGVNQAIAANGQYQEMMLSFGFAGRLPSVTQACSVTCMEHQQANTSVGNIIRDDVFLSTLTSAAGTVSEGTRLEMTSFDSGGYTYTTRNAAVAVQHIYLALDLGDRHVYCDAPQIDTSSIGNKTVTGAGFTPALVITSVTRNGNLNTLLATQNGISIGAASASSAQSAAGANSLDNQATSDTHCAVASNDIVWIPQTSGATYLIGALSSFDADGWTLNVSDTGGAAQPIPYMAIEDREEIVTTETVGISDEVVLILMQTVVITETVGISDQVVLEIPTIVVSETVSISDQVVLVTGTAGDLLIVVSETVGIEDKVVFDGSGTIVVSETVGIADTVTPFLGNLIVVAAETVGISDQYASSGLIPTKGNWRGDTLQGGAEAGAVLGAHAERGEALGG